jgi:hypothetical protein
LKRATLVRGCPVIICHTSALHSFVAHPRIPCADPACSYSSDVSAVDVTAVAHVSLWSHVRVRAVLAPSPKAHSVSQSQQKRVLAALERRKELALKKASIEHARAEEMTMVLNDSKAVRKKRNQFALMVLAKQVSGWSSCCALLYTRHHCTRHRHRRGSAVCFHHVVR